MDLKREITIITDGHLQAGRHAPTRCRTGELPEGLGPQELDLLGCMCRKQWPVPRTPVGRSQHGLCV